MADVFDALMSRRTYKESMTVEKAIQILIEGSGLDFDPDVVECFIALRSQFEEVALRWRDD